MTSIDQLRTKIRKSIASVGTWMQIPSSEIAEILSATNSYDWIVVDMEHGSFSRDQLPSIVRSIETNSVLPFVRLQTNEVRSAKDVVDCGFKGFIVPMIEDKEQLDKIHEAITYPPTGRRGVGFSKSNQYGINFKKNIESSFEPFLVAMIETVKGLGNLEQILSSECLDALIIGPYDLSASLGTCGEFDSPEFKKAYDQIRKLCNKYNVPFGSHLIDPCNLRLKKTIDDGAKFIAFSMDSVMIYASKPNI